MFKIILLFGLLLKGWMAAELDPLRTGRIFGLPINMRFIWTMPGLVPLVFGIEECMIWGSCVALIFQHYNPWIWVSSALLGSYLVPKLFIEARRKNDKYFQDSMILGYLRHEISSYPEIIKNMSTTFGTLGLAVAQEQAKNIQQSYENMSDKEQLKAALRRLPEFARPSEEEIKPLIDKTDCGDLSNLPDDFYEELVGLVRSKKVYYRNKQLLPL